jgi:intein/homing endonuclease
MHFRASTSIDGEERGYMSEIMGMTFNDGNYQKHRGKRGDIYIEEMGAFPNVETVFNVARSSVEEADTTFGLILGFGTGGCVCKGTVVWDKEGKPHNIEKLPVNNGILGFDGKKVSKEDITYWQKPTKKQCYKIITNTKREIECSNDHPILTNKQGEFYRLGKGNERIRYKKTDFLPAENIKVGDYLAIAETIDIYGDKSIWEPRLLGWIIGDGSYGQGQTVKFSNCEKEINDYLYQNFDTNNNLERTTLDNKIYIESNIRGIIPKLRELGIYGQTKLNKRFPYEIYSSTKKDICEFIGGLFDTDGYVNIRENKKRKTYIGEISFSSASIILIEELRLLLSKLGIHGTIRKRLPRESNTIDKNPWYEFVIASATSLVKFSEQIKLFPKEKQRRLDLIREEFSKISPTNKTEGISFEQVVEIINIGIQDVYNLTANNTHTYIANGIITHNTEASDFGDMEKMFYSPESYNIRCFDNIYDEGLQGTKCAYFTPAYRNIRFKDANGNSLEQKAKEFRDTQRVMASKSPDANAIIQEKAEHPYSPQEAILRSTYSVLPANEAIEWYNKVINLGLHKLGINGKLSNVDGKIEFKPDENLKPVDRFPHNIKDNLEGCIVQYYAPYRINGKVPDGLYVIAHDPYAFDQSTDSQSIGAAYVYMVPNNIRSAGIGDRLVATYFGRPATIDDYNKNLFLLAQYYNAKIGFENDRGDVIGYAKRFKLLDWLESEFELAFDADLPKSGVKRQFGMHIGSGKENIRLHKGNKYLADWLITPRGKDDEGVSRLNIHTIYCPSTLKEIQMYRSDNGNFDRISALRILAYYMKELVYKESQPTANQETYVESFWNQRHFR